MTVNAVVPETGSPQTDFRDETLEARSNRSNALAIATLVAIPVAFFGAAAALGGNLLLSGDNLLQNYPLRVLAGSDLRHGSMPFWDPYIWSGTPLMAGLNAGAFYPANLLYAVVSSHVAWVLGQMLVYSAIGVGTYLLLRCGGTSVGASFLGAFSFTFAGAVLSQTAVHIDMGDGLASLPWALIAVRRIGEDRRLRWAALFAAAFTLVILSGSPEATLDLACVCAVYAVLRRSSRYGTWWAYVSRMGLGASVALGLTAFVWVPALHFIGHSQRPSAGATFASSYSFSGVSSVLGLVPYLEGGYRLLSQPTYFGVSNSEEVAFYVGILPVVAGLTLLTKPWRKRLPAGELRLWYGILIAGAVLAAAEATPLEHLIYHIPFYGQQRDSGRNIVDVDLALCALLAWWADGGSRAERMKAPPGTSRVEKVTAALPLLAVACIGIVFAVSSSTVLSLLEAKAPFEGPVGSGAAVVLALGLAAAGFAVAASRRRCRRSVWMRWVTAFVVVDVALFAIGSGYAAAQQPPGAGSSSSSVVLSLVKKELSPGGRYAVFDPDLYDSAQFVAAGEPDVGILDQIPSFSGYGSIVDSRYADRTGAQVRGSLDAAQVQSGQFRTVGLQVIVTVPESFLVPLAAAPSGSGLVRQKEQPGQDPVVPGGDAPPPRPPLMSIPLSSPRSEVATGTTSSWWYGTTLDTKVLSLVLGSPSQGQLVRIGSVAGDGKIAWGSPERITKGGRDVEVSFAAHGRGLALQVLDGPPLRSVEVAAEASTGRWYLEGGPLSNALRPGAWTESATVDDFVLMRATYTPRATWLEGSKTTPDASVVSTSADGVEIRAHASGSSTLVWSSAWDPGWKAQLVTPSGSKPLAVRRIGLVLGVTVPAGSDLVRFSYTPPGFPLGSCLALMTLGVVILAGITIVWRKRRVARKVGASG